MGGHGHILTAGHQDIKRELKIWDSRKFDKPLLVYSLDSNYSAMMPFYDSNLNILWLASKKETIIIYFEYIGGKLNYY